MKQRSWDLLGALSFHLLPGSYFHQSVHSHTDARATVTEDTGCAFSDGLHPVPCALMLRVLWLLFLRRIVWSACLLLQEEQKSGGSS